MGSVSTSASDRWIAAVANGPANAVRSSASPSCSEECDKPGCLGLDPGFQLCERAPTVRRDERRPVPGVLVAVEGEHRRTDDLAGGESGVVDRQRVGVAHRVDRRVTRQHQPPVGGVDPHDLAALPKRMQVLRVRVRAGQLLQCGLA